MVDPECLKVEVIDMTHNNDENQILHNIAESYLREVAQYQPPPMAQAPPAQIQQSNQPAPEARQAPTAGKGPLETKNNKSWNPGSMQDLANTMGSPMGGDIASSIVDMDSGNVFRMNDGIAKIVAKHKGKHLEMDDFNHVNPAGVRGKEGYSTQRRIKQDEILNQRLGQSGVVTPWFVAGSVDKSSHSAGDIKNALKSNGVSRGGLSSEAEQVMQNFEKVQGTFKDQKKSRTRFTGGPTKRGTFDFSEGNTKLADAEWLRQVAIALRDSY